MKKIFIHSGLHKTGTTALQAIFLKNKENLINQNFYYPDSGIPRNLYGHHNLAWQISRDRRYRSELGDFRTLLKEIQHVDGDNIIISSEDFECSLLHPNKLNKLNQFFLANNIKVYLIVYLRNQVDYLDSLYFELLKVGFGDEFSKFANKIISTNKFDFKEWEFVFDYLDLIESLKAVPDMEIIYRNYDDLIGDDIIIDFCEVVGMDYGKLEINQSRNRINERMPVNTLLKLFVKNRLRVVPDGLLDCIDELLGNLSYDMQASITVRKLMKDLNCKKSIFGYKEAEYEREEISGALDLERLFSFETHGLILKLRMLNETPDRKEKIIENWRRWVELKVN